MKLLKGLWIICGVTRSGFLARDTVEFSNVFFGKKVEYLQNIS